MEGCPVDKSSSGACPNDCRRLLLREAARMQLEAILRRLYHFRRAGPNYAFDVVRPLKLLVSSLGAAAYASNYVEYEVLSLNKI